MSKPGNTVFGLRPGVIRSGTVTEVKLISPNLKWKAIGDGSGSDDTISWPLDVAFLPNGKLVISEETGILGFDLNGQLEFIIRDDDLQLAGVTVCGTGQFARIAAVDRKDRTVKFYDLEGDFVHSWESKMFGEPRGIAVNSKGEVIITDIDPNYPKISVLNLEGKLIRQIGSHSPGDDRYLSTPTYLDIDHMDRIIVSDHDQHCLKAFDSQGHYLVTLSGMKHPNGIFADAMDHILVADSGNKCVSLYSGTSGRMIQSVLTNGSSFCPGGLDMTSGGYLAVTDSKRGKGSVSLYQV